MNQSLDFPEWLTAAAIVTTGTMALHYGFKVVRALSRHIADSRANGESWWSKATPAALQQSRELAVLVEQARREQERREQDLRDLRDLRDQAQQQQEQQARRELARQEERQQEAVSDALARQYQALNRTLREEIRRVDGNIAELRERQEGLVSEVSLEDGSLNVTYGLTPLVPPVATPRVATPLPRVQLEQTPRRLHVGREVFEVSDLREWQEDAAFEPLAQAVLAVYPMIRMNEVELVIQAFGPFTDGAPVALHNFIARLRIYANVRGPAPDEPGSLAAEIRGALARAYTRPLNTHKVLDPDLLEAMLVELLRLDQFRQPVVPVAVPVISTRPAMTTGERQLEL